MNALSIRRHIGSVGFRVLRPAFAWRGRIVSRVFRFGDEGPRFYDPTARAAIEAVIDAFEGWLLAPDFARMEATARECERIGEELAEIRARFGLDEIPATTSPLPKDGEKR